MKEEVKETPKKRLVDLDEDIIVIDTKELASRQLSSIQKNAAQSVADQANALIKALNPSFVESAKTLADTLMATQIIATEGILRSQTESIRSIADSLVKYQRDVLTADLNRLAKPLLDIRLGIFASFSSSQFQAKVLRDSMVDVGSMLGRMHTSSISSLALSNVRITEGLISGVATEEIETDYLVERRERKVELKISLTEEQTVMLVEAPRRLDNIEATLEKLVEQGQQGVSVKSIKYSPETFTLKIGGKLISVAAGKERQLCELLLSNPDNLKKVWDLEEFLEHIGENDHVDWEDYKIFMKPYYLAAYRFNQKLKDRLGFNLLKIDIRTEKLYVNPLFYNK